MLLYIGSEACPMYPPKKLEIRNINNHLKTFIMVRFPIVFFAFLFSVGVGEISAL
jgi:hypothetical protein